MGSKEKSNIKDLSAFVQCVQEYVCARACVCVRVCACACACVCVYVRDCVCVCARACAPTTYIAGGSCSMSPIYDGMTPPIMRSPELPVLQYYWLHGSGKVLRVPNVRRNDYKITKATSFMVPVPRWSLRLYQLYVCPVSDTFFSLQMHACYEYKEKKANHILKIKER